MASRKNQKYNDNFGVASSMFYLKLQFPGIPQENLKTIKELLDTTRTAIYAIDKKKIKEILTSISSLLNSGASVETVMPVSHKTMNDPVMFINFSDNHKITFLYDATDERFKIMSLEALRQAKLNGLQSRHLATNTKTSLPDNEGKDTI